MDEKRNNPRRRLLKGGFIVVSDQAPKLECTVKNISETGAALQVSTTFGMPEHFDVIIDGVRYHCRQVWRTDTTIGVMFS